jgi:RNA polymerase sigma-70 factor (ECF subfamily)
VDSLAEVVPQPVAPDFAVFYLAHFEGIVAAVRSLAGPAAEDVAQEAFFAAHRRWGTVSHYDLPVAWVRRVAVRMAVRTRQREQRRRDLRGNLFTSVCSAETDVDVVAALAELPQRSAAALTLHHLLDQPVRGVAEQLGLSEGATKVLLHRARSDLAGRVSGLRGRWVSERLWTVDRVVQRLVLAGGESHVDTVLEDLRHQAGRWELHLTEGAYLLRRDDGMRLDEGRALAVGHHLELHPRVGEGRVLLRTALDGNRLKITLVDNTTPATKEVPDSVWMDLFLAADVFVYDGRRRSRL